MIINISLSCLMHGRFSIFFLILSQHCRWCKKGVGHASVHGGCSPHGHIGMGDCAFRYAQACARACVVLPPLSMPMRSQPLSHGTRVKISSPGLGGGAVLDRDPKPHGLPSSSSNMPVKRQKCLKPFLAWVLGTCYSCSVTYCIYQLPWAGYKTFAGKVCRWHSGWPDCNNIVESLG